MRQTKIKNSLLFEDIQSTYSYDKRNLEYLKPIIDRRFYFYGDHFKNAGKNDYFRDFSYGIILSIYVFVFSFLQNLYFIKKNKKIILSNSYFDFDNKFSSLYNQRISRLPWRYNFKFSNVYNRKLYNKIKKFKYHFDYANLEYLLSEDFAFKISELKNDFRHFLLNYNVTLIVLSQDEDFFEQVMIDVSKELGIKTVANVHGLQFYLNSKSWSRTDYLLVWGELSKLDFVRNNFDPSRIIVTGHPNNAGKIPETIRFGLENILVISNSLNGIRPNDDLTLADRSNSIYYLRVIMRVLKKLSITKARVRIHPSENINFYKKNIDLDFYIIDTDTLDSSLSKTTLVIGPTSTVFFDSFKAGVYYLIFQLEFNGVDLINGYRIPGMYNGDNSKVPVAKSEKELVDLIISGNVMDTSILYEIGMNDFDLTQLKKIVF